jgi:acetyl-CoA carboxylase carboxyl transferase subunit beta
MGWFLNLVRPKIRSNNDSAIPENLWKSCSACNEIVFIKEWESSLYVCPACNFHERIGAKLRIEMLSHGKPDWINLPIMKDDPLKFKDQKSYKDRLRDARAHTDLKDAVLAAQIKLNGNSAIVLAMDFGFIGGSMGANVGAAFAKCAEIAATKKIPLIAVTASGGARMQEGVISLMQMPKTAMACNFLKERGVPYIVVLTDPTTGGVLASFAMLGDITIAEPNALLGFTGPRVIEETMGIKLEPGFQKSEFQFKHGFIDCVVKRSDLKYELGKIIGIFNAKKRK